MLCPDQLTLDSLLAHKTAGEKDASIPQAGSCAVLEGRSDQAHRPVGVYQKT